MEKRHLLTLSIILAEKVSPSSPLRQFTKPPTVTTTPASAIPAKFHRQRSGSNPNIKTTLSASLSHPIKKVSLDNSYHMKASFERLSSLPAHCNTIVDATTSGVWGGSCEGSGSSGARGSGSLTRHGGSINHISSPKLISHSISLNKYTFHDARCSSDHIDCKSSSEDSGVSDDCYTSHEGGGGGGGSPRMGVKLSPLHRKATLSEKMKGMFRRVNSVNNVNKE